MMVVSTFNTTPDAADGHIIDGHACGKVAINTASSMLCGVSDDICLSDSNSNRYHSDCSFDTSVIPDNATITAVSLWIYVSSVIKSRRLIWNVAFDAKLLVTTRKDEIGASLGTGNYDYGTIRYSSNAFKTWGAGWKEFSLGAASVYKDGDTDCEIRPNQDWYNDLNNQGLKFYLICTTNEGGANKPYLEVTYTVPASNMKINIGDDWKDVVCVKVNIGDDWKEVVAVKLNVGDAWKEV